MERQRRLKEITKIFREVLQKEDLCLSEETVPDDIEEWDSYSQITILAQIEHFYHIKFRVSEMKKMNHVKSILDILDERGV